MELNMASSSQPVRQKRLPERGPKLLLPSDDAKVAVELKIQKALEHHKSLFTVAEAPNARSIAEWDPERRRAIVKKRVGKLFETYGTEIKNELFLHPEEALLLIEMHYLELRWNEVELSTQQAYAVILQGEDLYTELGNYRMFSKLARSGYRLLRHKPIRSEVDLTESELSPPSKRFKYTDDAPQTLQPLINTPSISTEDILDRLQIIKRTPNGTNHSDSQHPILFDVFSKECGDFCKGRPPPPDFTIRSGSPTDCIPSNSSSSNLNVYESRFAINAFKDVVFYDVSIVDVTNLFVKKT